MNPFVIETELRREPGNSRRVDTSVVLEEPMGTEVIGIPAGASVHLDLLLESVMEGILVSGVVSGTLQGDCVRCLKPLEREFESRVTELYSYPDMVEEQSQEDDAEPVPVVEEDTVDLSEMIIDGVVLELPFNPVCGEDCQGLCQECGINLNENPGHEHEAPVDPRWAELSKLLSDDEQ